MTTFSVQDKKPRVIWGLLLGICLWVVFVLATDAILALAQSYGLTGLLGSFDILIYNIVIYVLSAFGALSVTMSALGLTHLCRCYIDKKPRQGIGLVSLTKGWRGLVSGFLTCVVMWGAYMGVSLLFSETSYKLPVEKGYVQFALVVFLYAAASGFSEELLVRGYLFQNLGERFPLWLSAVSIGLFFAALRAIVAPSTFSILGLLYSVISSLAFTVMRLHARSLWFGIGFHATMSWLAVAIGGTNPVIFSLLALLLVLAWNRCSARPIRWSARLADDGSIDDSEISRSCGGQTNGSESSTANVLSDCDTVATKR